MPRADIDAAHEIYRQLVSESRSLILATTNADGSPAASTAPFIVDELRRFTIFTSQLAEHTANLRRDNRAGVMLIEDEAATAQLFARQRVTFQCRVEAIPRDSAEGAALLARFEERFGKMVGLLKSLPDFQLFRLQPESGGLVTGFGQAFTLSGDSFQVITPRGRG
ncbi:MAG: heme utilization protein HutZ [Anaerolineae bacterium]